jgi:hypothetical protein
MPDGAGGSHPDPEEIERKRASLPRKPASPGSMSRRRLSAWWPSGRRKRKLSARGIRVLAATALIVGGGVYTWLRVAPPSWLHHRAAAHAVSSARTAPSARAPKVLGTPLSPVTANGRPIRSPARPRTAGPWARPGSPSRPPGRTARSPRRRSGRPTRDDPQAADRREPELADAEWRGPEGLRGPALGAAAEAVPGRAAHDGPR